VLSSATASTTASVVGRQAAKTVVKGGSLSGSKAISGLIANRNTATGSLVAELGNCYLVQTGLLGRTTLRSFSPSNLITAMYLPIPGMEGMWDTSPATADVLRSPHSLGGTSWRSVCPRTTGPGQNQA
jgi:hypothetical protein